MNANGDKQPKLTGEGWSSAARRGKEAGGIKGESQLKAGQSSANGDPSEGRRGHPQHPRSADQSEEDDLRARPRAPINISGDATKFNGTAALIASGEAQSATGTTDTTRRITARTGPTIENPDKAKDDLKSGEKMHAGDTPNN